jgi:hypothetical protein
VTVAPDGVSRPGPGIATRDTRPVPRRGVELRSRIGFEIELLAPPDGSRSDLAAEIARLEGGSVRPVFHGDSQPSLVPGMGHFLTLTQGFAVDGPGGEVLCTLVDDITVRAGLDPGAPPRSGWSRILSDEARLLRLAERYCDPAAGPAEVLDPLAEVFGVPTEPLGDVVRLNDASGATVAVATGLPGERHRPCEVVTAPLAQGHREALEALLAPARSLGFVVPEEAAVHLHLDGAPFRTVATFCNVVRLFARWREPLWRLLDTNPRCQRLAAVPEPMVALAEDPATGRLGWEEFVGQVRGTGLRKFMDVNLTQLVAPRPIRDTLEVRILPGSRDGATIVHQAAVVERLLERCRDERPLPAPSVPLEHLLDGSR